MVTFTRRSMEWLNSGFRMRKSSKAKLREAFLHLENEVPGGVARQVRNLRHPDARWVRLPIGVLFVVGGLLAPVVPILGVWMIPLGLLLLAYDVPFLRRPTANFTIWSTRKWVAVKEWFSRRVRRTP
ncbi:hypothetical protein AAII07_49165 [Microvirga sp. 0TCS3.31]